MSGGMRTVALSVLAVATLSLAAGCAAAADGKPVGSIGHVTRCGTGSTAAGVPVVVEIVRGSVPCKAAMAIQRDYAKAIASGKVPGNGGGAPVTIRGWVCQGFNTPVVLATGHASACRKGGAEILAVLPEPAPGATASLSRQTPPRLPSAFSRGPRLAHASRDTLHPQPPVLLVSGDRPSPAALAANGSSIKALPAGRSIKAGPARGRKPSMRRAGRAARRPGRWPPACASDLAPTAGA